MKKLFLVITAGVSDVNILYKEGGEHIRLLPELDCVRLFHEEILERSYTFSNPRKKIKKAVYRKQPIFGSNDISVYLPKIMPLLDMFDTYNSALAEEDSFRIVGSVVLNTKRESINDEGFDEILNTEPYACGQLISEYIANRYDIGFDNKQHVGDMVSTWVDYLTGSMDITENGTINRSVVDTLNMVIREICDIPKNQNELNDYFILYLSAGGFPIVKDFVRELLNYEYSLKGMDNSWQHIFTCKFSRTENYIDFAHLFKYPVQYIELESIQIRKQVVSLVHKGYIESAGDIAKRLMSDVNEFRWVNKVIQLSSFFKPVPDIDVYLDENSLMKSILYIEHYGEVLRSAMRVEASLRRGDFSQFVINLINFKDLFLYQYLKNRIVRDHGETGSRMVFNISDQRIENISPDDIKPSYTRMNQNHRGSTFNNIIHIEDEKIKYDFTNNTFRAFLINNSSEETNVLNHFISLTDPARRARNKIIHSEEPVNFTNVLDTLRRNKIITDNSFIRSSVFIELLQEYIGLSFNYGNDSIPWGNVYNRLIQETIDVLRNYTLVQRNEN